MSDSVRPHRRQPARLPHPWDSPGKNTGVGYHFLLQCMKVKSESEVSHVRLLATPWTAPHQAPLSMGFSRQECWSGVLLPSPLFLLVYFYFSVVFFISVQFTFSNSLLQASNILLWASTLLRSSLIMFTIITFNSFSGRFPVSTSLSYFSEVLSCSFIWNMFLCHLSLCSLLLLSLCV